jgi:hypothetical protein
MARGGSRKETMTMRRWWMALCIAGSCGACASEQGRARARTSEQPAETQESAGATEGAVPPEKVDEIQEILRRKQQDLAHCWNEEAERSKNRSLVVDLMLKLTIGSAGKANRVEMVRNSIQSKDFDACVLGMVRNFDFPAIPAALELTWPYSFKPLY